MFGPSTKQGPGDRQTDMQVSYVMLPLDCIKCTMYAKPYAQDL